MPAIYERAGKLVEERLAHLAEAIVDRQWQEQPDLAVRYDDAGRTKCVRDVGYNLRYLVQALRADQPALFVEYIAWLKVLFARLDIPDKDLAQSLRFTQVALRRELPASEAAAADAVLAAALDRLPQMPSSLPSYLDDSAPYAGLAGRYLAYLLNGERHPASRLILDAVTQGGAPVRDIYVHVFQPCQYEIGRLWQMNQISIAQEHFCTAATQLVMSQLYPFVFATPKCGRRLVAACVGQELHEIGLRMVADLFELEGWDTLYLGASTPAQSIAATVADHAPDVLAISATMTFHLPNVAEVIEHVRSSLASPPKILVGGYPFNLAPELWREVGADGYASDAGGAIAIANKLLESTL